VKILTIGRKGAQILLDDGDSQISRLHAELTVSDKGTYYLVDCGSSNGTFVKRDGTWKTVRQEFVTDSDQIRFGSAHVTTVRELLRKAS
jgi:pSer/pThr/pTyr-binding forkhead associated (FHA) protein